MARTRLCIVDDHQMFREGVAASLAAECDVVGTVGSGAELLDVLRRHPVDCVLLDLSMPGMNGLEVLPEARHVSPATRFVIVTMFADRGLATEALRLGAAGYVPKDAGVGELLVAIRHVMAGELYLSPKVPKTSHRVGLAARHPGLSAMTPRQQEIFIRFGQGESWSEIANDLHVSGSTVTFHKQNIARLIGIHSESELRRLATLLAAEVLAQ